MTRRLLIVGLQRSGTTFAAATVAGHPQVTALAPELRHNFFSLGVQDFVAGEATFETVQETYPRLFDAMTTNGGGGDVRVRAAKTAVASHAESVAVCDCLDPFLPDMAVVLVTRRDLIASCGSLVRAQRSGVWHSWAGRSPSGSTRIPTRLFRRYAQMARATVQRFRTLAASHDFLELSYEDDICTGKAHSRLFEFLELEQVEPSWVKLQKLNPDARSYISNYDKLERVLATLPDVDPERESALASTLRRTRSRELSTPFLLGRAAFQAGVGRVQQALDDLQQAMAHADAPNRTHELAKTYAALEAAGAAESSRSLLDRIDQVCGNNPSSLQARATQREMAGNDRLALADLMAALQADEAELGENGVHAALKALARVLPKLEMPDARLALEALEARHGQHPQFSRVRDMLQA